MAFRGTLQRLRVLKHCVEALESDISTVQTSPLRSWHHNKTTPLHSQLTQSTTSTKSSARQFSMLSTSRTFVSHVQPASQTTDILHVQNRHLPQVYCSIRNGSSGEDVNPRTEVTYDELVKLIESEDILLFDVREPKEIEQTGLMPGAINIPITKLKNSFSMEEDEFRNTYGCQKPNGLGQNLLFSGFSNVKSEAALELAHKAGFKKARHYPGGWKEWSEKQNQN